MNWVVATTDMICDTSSVAARFGERSPERHPADAEVLGEVALDVDRHVAQADRPMPAIDEGLGHDPDRVREIDDPGTRRRAPAGQFGELEHERDRAQRLGQATGTGRLLADDTEGLRQRLVGQPRRLAADAELDEHEIGTVDGGVAIAAEDEPAAPVEAIQHPTGQATDDRQPLGIDVE